MKRETMTFTHKTLFAAILSGAILTACSTDDDSISPEFGTMTDSRDNQTYKIVTLGDATWMAENLNYKANDSWCYDNDTDNCEIYGRLYTWSSAKDNVCPSGWHLPSNAEWDDLFDMVTEDPKEKALKSTTWGDSSQTKLNPNDPYGAGTDLYGMNILPAGMSEYLSLAGRVFKGLRTEANFWTSDNYDEKSAKHICFQNLNGNRCGGYTIKTDGLSIRCVKD